MDSEILQQARALSGELQALFCDLHRQPELGRREYKTQARILEALKKLDIPAQPIADTGVVAVIYGGKPGRTVALRADMDALPVQEQTGLAYASENAGVMHACGHDSHMAMLLGAAKLLSDRKDRLCGNVKLLFQPDEENDGGAQRMIQAGCMENPHVDGVFFGHAAPQLPVGTASVRSGPVSAASNPFSVVFRGRSTHGAHPELGEDVIATACRAVTELKKIKASEPMVISVGTFHAGTAGNILPGEAVISGIIRTLTPQSREQVTAAFRQTVLQIAADMGVTAEIDLRQGYSATANDEKMVSLMRTAGEKVLQQVCTTPAPTLETEDIGYFFQKAPGCYYQLGVGSDHPLHSPQFTVDLEALPYGAALYTQIALDFLEE